MRPRLRHNLQRLSRISLQNIGRNLFLSVATTVMMGLILFIFNVIMVLNVLTQSSIQELGEKVDLIVYVSESASVLEIAELVQEVESIPVVEAVNYTSPEEALESFTSIYPDQTDPFTLYGIENPLPGNIQIITQDVSQHGLVIDALQESSFANVLVDIESSDENQVIVSRLLSVTNFTKKLIIGVTVTFIFGSILMIMNAIHLSIFTRQREIQIMQLVGAKPSMIRFPFLFEGAVYSSLAVLFSLILLMIFVEGTKLRAVTHFQESFHIVSWIGLEFIVSVLIGVIASTVAINYYLKRTLVLKPS